MNDDYSFLKGSHLHQAQSRRGFIKGTGSMLALGTLPGYLSADVNKLQASHHELQRHNGLVLFRENDRHSAFFAGILSQAGLQTIALTDDPVRQWRDGLMEAMSGVPVLGLTNWTDYFVLKGLAAEQRKHVMLELKHDATDQPDKQDWSTKLAIKYLQLPAESESTVLQAHFQALVNKQQLASGQRSMFSWLIA